MYSNGVDSRDNTNQQSKQHSLQMSPIDMAWGALASGIAAAAGKLALDYLNK